MFLWEDKLLREENYAFFKLKNLEDAVLIQV